MSTSGVSTTSSGLLANQLIDESGGLTSGSTLTNEGADGTLQLTGLASGINTTELIQAELAQQEEPLDNMEDEVSALNTENSTLSSIQDALQTVSSDALILGEPSTFFPVQNISSSDSSLITAATSDGVGATIGSTSITVTALASASQTAFAYTQGTTTAENSLSITVDNSDGVAGSTTDPPSATYSLNVADDATPSQIANAINGNGSLGVWATVNNGQLILSSQQTGSNYTVASATLAPASGSDGTTTASIGAGTSTAGTDATYYLNGSSTAQYSSSDTVTGAIAGVTLTLAGITGDSPTDNPVTITTEAPGPDTTAIVQQIQQFVSDYNNALNGIETAVNTAPASESTPSDYSPYSGSLFGDDQLEDFTGDLRTSVYQDYAVNGGPDGPTTGPLSLQDIGISSGSPTATASTSTVDGDLTVDTTQLTAAIESNPSGVQALITAWSQNFQSIVNDVAAPTGSISARITGNNATVTSLNSQLTSQEAMYSQEEQTMEQQWAQVESTLEDLDNQKTDLSSFTDGLTTSSSSS